ncbi:FAD-dependent oxidoreductase [Streptacidiphilus cavernicola]|uniref:FAD-dependent oxidoreductase n=1 Tax=Streptacidiphilus cavernicola TaxID=3342716 RepID=A0ABV6W5F8_9ACTN
MPSSPSRLFAEISTALPPTGGGVTMGRAVVLGGSMAGLMAARVLSEHAEEVVLIERDGSTADGGEPDAPRAGVPQGAQVHALLGAGALQLERWFPGFVAEAVAGGAVTPPPDGSREWFFTDGRRRVTAPVAQDWPVLVSTRPFLEALVRRRTLAADNVRLVAGRADGITFEGERVSGVRYLPQGRDGAEDEITVEADLVVDAMGRSSRLGDWLRDGGWQRPPVRRMPIRLTYATALFKHDPAVTEAWNAVSVDSADPAAGRPARIGGFILVEGERWMMLVAGYGEDRPSRDTDDYLRRCREDFPKVFGDIAERAEMISEVVTYHQADSRRRDFHALRRLPAGLVAAGDAVASFNPVYGQGMTSATLHASCLSSWLRAEGTSIGDPARGYFDLVRVVVDAAWQVSTFADLDLPHVDGPYPRGYRLTKWFAGVLFELAVTDRVIAARFARITAMLAHPHALARPGLLLRALWLYAVLRRRGPAAD